MINTLDHLIVAVSDIDEAEKNYSKVFGMGPVWRGEHIEYGTKNSLFNFNNTYFELLAAKGEGLGAALVNHTLQETGEGLIGIVFGTDNLKKTHEKLSKKGLPLGDISFGEGVNLKNNKIRKWRMLFFRFNKTTIEVLEKKNDEEPKDALWGLSWEVDNIEEAHSRLKKAGVEITPIKKGIKDNTMVATLKSHTHNVPTLLIQHI